MSTYLRDKIMRGLASARPTAGDQGRIYFATDTGAISRDNGSSWDDVTPPGVPSTRTVNGHALSSDVTVTKSDVGLSNVTNDAQWKAADVDTSGTLAANSDSKVATQKATKTYVDTAVAGIGAVSSVDGASGAVKLERVVEVMLNDSTALTTSAVAYFRIPAPFNGMNLVAVAAACKVASSSGTPTFTVKNGSTSMLSTNLTIDASETDSSTAATAAVIDTSHDDVSTGNLIEVACSVAGTGVTYAVVELTFQLP